MVKTRAHEKGCSYDLDHTGECNVPEPGKVRCCDYGYFDEMHLCQKEPGTLRIVKGRLRPDHDHLRDYLRDAMQNNTTPMRTGWDSGKRERAIKTGWHVLLVGVAVVEWRTARTQLRKHMLMACAGWHVSCAVVDWFSK